MSNVLLNEWGGPHWFFFSLGALLFFLSVVSLIGTILMGLKGNGPESSFLSVIGMAVIAAFSGVGAAFLVIPPGVGDVSVSSDKVSQLVQQNYGATTVTDMMATKDEGNFVYDDFITPGDAANNSMNIGHLVLKGKTYRDCTASFTNVKQDGKRTTADMQLQCGDTVLNPMKK